MKHFEEEYRKHIHENTPDLWDRIEAGLSEKTKRSEQTAAHIVPDNWKVIENKIEEKSVNTEDPQDKRRNPQHYLRGILTAAAGFFIITAAAVTLNMKQKSVEEAQNASPMYSAEETAYDNISQQAPEDAAEYDLAEEAAETAEVPDNIYAETDEMQDFKAYERAEENVAAEETAAFSDENMMESEEMPVFSEKDSAGAETMAASSAMKTISIEELGIALTVPETLAARPLTVEEEKEGYICGYTGISADGITPQDLTVRYIDAEAETLDEYRTIAEKEADVSHLVSSSYSGIEFLEYTREDKKAFCMLYFPEKGTPVELSVTPASPESEAVLRSVTRYKG